ncbi:MAG: hypothetical protein LUD57_03900 [Ruminococcus sp.]|nr:hypothetical protein [Ruminococcus sp.]
MEKKELKRELTRTIDSYPSAYYSLSKLVTILQFITVIVLILGIIASIICGVVIDAVSFLIVLVSICMTAGVIYIISAALNALASLICNAFQTKHLLLIQIKLDNDLMDED